MPVPRSATLAVWARAWLSGRIPFDDVIATVTADGRPHTVVGRSETGSARPPGRVERPYQADPGHPVHPTHHPDLVAPPERLGAALIAWRAGGADVRVVLPVAGDVRGVPGPRPFLDAALAAGEAVYGGGLGLVPQPPADPERPGPREIVWRAFSVDDAPPDPLSLADAEHELAAAVRETATLFTATGIGGGTASTTAHRSVQKTVQEDLARARRASEAIRIPPGFPPRAAALLAQAERLHAALAVAARDPLGGATDRGGITVRAEALRALHTTVRRARLAGYNADAAERTAD